MLHNQTEQFSSLRQADAFPETFFQQSREAAKYVEVLDSGGGLENPSVRRFLSQLGNTDYIGFLHFPDALVRVDPQVALPFWLKRDFLINNGLVKPKDRFLDKDQRERTQALYDKFIAQRRIDSFERTNGRYDVIIRRESNVPAPRRFKMYVEQKGLLEALENGSLDRVFTHLTSRDHQPHTMKLFDDDSLVWYFDLDVAQSEAVEQVFLDQNVDYRIPSQDVYRASASDKDGLSVYIVTSNDNAFRPSDANDHHRYRVAEYSAEKFLEDYLLLCSKVGKNPAAPSLTSFIYLYDLRSNKEKPEELMSAAETKVGYPIVYKRGSLFSPRPLPRRV
ncbi:hypothetical protein HYW66_01195 [Candidatus Microgenomates bacterium]|nr:hypothetical protein [Candidatus Microgenomates bacterium]